MTDLPNEAQGPQRIMELSSGLWASKALSTALHLDLFGALAAHPGATPTELADRLGISARPMRSLLAACAALGLLTRVGERCFNTPLSQRHLVRTSPDYFGGWVEMLDRHDYPGWMQLHDALRHNRPTAWNPDEQDSLFDNADPVMLDTFWEAMTTVSTVTARQLGSRLDLTRTRALLDVGGGGAAWDIELCRMHPPLRAAVYDLPHVCELTQKKIDQANLGDRITTIPGDFFADTSFPEGYDTHLVSSVLHDWSDAQCRELLARSFTALPSNGRLVIAELLIDDTEDGPLDAALMGLAMQVETWGRSFTAAELTSWLTRTGFTDVHVTRIHAPTANAGVIARKP
ncbi:methyltransferase [Streptomyces smyrnaeus]|uniref:methyltransferase n=1 Tax=Streptomyces smyrnaeus TaxID=1387713 RepID=UPI0036C480E4